MSKPIRVLHFGPAIGFGGVATFVMNIYREIDRERVQFDFLISYEPVGKELENVNEVHSLGGRIFSAPPTRKSPLKAMKIQKDIILNHGIDILHCNFMTLAQIAPAQIACSAGIPTVIHSHQAGAKRRYGFVKSLLSGDFNEAANNLAIKANSINREKLLNLPCHLIACSKSAGVELFGTQAVNAGRVTVVPNAINVADFTYNAEYSIKMKERFGIGNKFVVGNIGRFEYQKNHEFIIKAFEALKQKLPGSVLLLVGDGIEKPKIEAEVKKLGLSDSVIFTGARYDVHNILQAMDVFILPSHYEGLGMVLIEAQASGLPCIASVNVPKETKILDTCEFLSLKEPLTNWSDAIVKYSTGYERKNTYDEIVKAGYDIKDTSKKLTEFYCRLAERKRT